MDKTTGYRMVFDYHTHSLYSHGLTPWTPHGKGTLDENASAAEAKGLEAIAVTEHGPGHLTYGIRMSDLPKIRKDIEKTQALHPRLRIYLSVEANIRDGEHSLDVRPEDAAMFDFIIGGYHLAVACADAAGNFTLKRGIFATEKRRMRTLVRNTDRIIRAVYENNLRILTHPGDKGPVDMTAIARACADTDTWMEISNFHSHLTRDEIRVASRSEAFFVVSSDAHSPGRIGSFEKGLARALDAGLDPARIVNIRPLET